MVSTNPQITVAKMTVTIGLSDRQVRKYIKKLTDLNLIIREGGRKNGSWKIIDEEYENFFEQL